jgi:hypothetical protein
MFNPTQVVIDAFVHELQTMYARVYGVLEPDYPGVIAFIGRVAMENIANSDAPYHNAEHTMMVTLVGQEILRGKHIREGGVTPRDWLHFIISLLCHDIGYVRGVCLGDGNGRYFSNEQGDLVDVPDGSTDASMTPYHVSRSKVFVRERFGRARLAQFDTLVIERNIEHTRFPFPESETHVDTTDFPGLVRAADLVGQLADMNYLRKIPALFVEFGQRETWLSHLGRPARQVSRVFLDGGQPLHRGRLALSMRDPGRQAVGVESLFPCLLPGASPPALGNEVLE